MRGDVYTFENIRNTEREKAIPYLQKTKRSEQEWKELVRKGLAVIKEELLPCNGKRISYHLL